jgi:Ca2+-binding EF-hand superfamily protein
MKLLTPVLLSAVLAGAVSSAMAQVPTPPKRNPFGSGALPEILKPYDLDGDGKLSVEERQAFIKAMKEAAANRPKPTNPFDTDGDGKLSEAERDAAQAALRAKIEAERTKRFKELDKNEDGSLSAEELAGAPHMNADRAAAMLARLDKDSNGSVSLEEFLAALGGPVRPPQPPKPPRPPQPPVGGGDGDDDDGDDDKDGPALPPPPPIGR